MVVQRSRVQWHTTNQAYLVRRRCHCQSLILYNPQITVSETCLSFAVVLTHKDCTQQATLACVGPEPHTRGPKQLAAAIHLIPCLNANMSMVDAQMVELDGMTDLFGK